MDLEEDKDTRGGKRTCNIENERNGLTLKKIDGERLDKDEKMMQIDDFSPIF